MIWDQQLTNVLQQSTKSFYIHNLKGYSFIHQLVKPHHPVLMHQPSNLMLQRPTQLKIEPVHFNL